MIKINIEIERIDYFMKFMIDYLNDETKIVEASTLDNAIKEATERLSPECNNCNIYDYEDYKTNGDNAKVLAIARFNYPIEEKSVEYEVNGYIYRFTQITTEIYDETTDTTYTNDDCILVHDTENKFGDGDFIVIDYEFPEDKEQAKNIIENNEGVSFYETDGKYHIDLLV